MDRILFLKDISRAKIECTTSKTLLVYHDHYKDALPKINGVEYMEFEKFKSVYSELEVGALIVVGLNRIITPSNRCDMVNDYMQTMTRNIEKISIDTSPFIGEPWRLWYHYDVTNCNTFNVPHGFAIETEWKHWFYRDRPDCRLSGDKIKAFINHTYSDLDLLKSNFNFYTLGSEEHKYCEEIKTFVLNRYNSPKLWVAHLLKSVNKHFNIDIWQSN